MTDQTTTSESMPMTENSFAAQNYVESAPEIKSFGSMDFNMLTPETPEMPSLDAGPVVTPETASFADTVLSQSETPAIENAPNASVRDANTLTMDQEKTKAKDAASAAKASVSQPSAPSNPSPSGGGGGGGGGGNTINIKSMTTFEKVVMETAFLPLWRSFNA